MNAVPLLCYWLHVSDTAVDSCSSFLMTSLKRILTYLSEN